MKKLILFAAILFGAHTANAQISEGDVLVGGDIAGLNVSFDNLTTFQLTPKAIWFVKDGLGIGGYGNFGLTHVNGADGTNYTYGIGPLARYYMKNDKIEGANQLKFFWEGNVGFQGVNSSGDGGTTNGMGFGAGPGITYFLNQSVGLEALVKYEGILGFGSNTYTNGLTFGLGFQVYLSGKKVEKQIKNL